MIDTLIPRMVQATRMAVAGLLMLVSSPGFGQMPPPEIIKWPALETILQKGSPDTVYVVNFWATWCKPCVHELPSFDSLAVKYAQRPVRVILVSLDFKKQYQDRLIPFLEKNQVHPTVVLLDEPDYNSWIDRVDKSWSGAIPATIIFKPSSGHRKFYEREFVLTELEKIITPMLNKFYEREFVLTELEKIITPMLN